MVATISSELEEFVQTEVSRGHFASRDEVISAALRLMRDQKAAWEERVREAIAEGDATSADDIVFNNEAEVEAFFEDINARGRKRLAAERSL